MKTYKAAYSPKIGAWMVLNTETNIYHSRWENSRRAFGAASDLNRAVAKDKFSRGMVTMMNTATFKTTETPKDPKRVLYCVPKKVV